MTLTKTFLICSLLIGLSALTSQGTRRLNAAPLLQASGDPPGRAPLVRPLAPNAEDFRSRYAPSYRRNPPPYRVAPLYPLRPGSRFGPDPRLQPNYQYVFPLDRYRAVPQLPPGYYRRMTPYYDGRGYGVPSTSPFRYHRDLDGPIGSQRPY